MTGAVVLRPAVPADAEAIAHVSVRTWRHAYEDFLDPRVLAERTVESQVPQWVELLAPGSGASTVVAETSGRVMAYAARGPSPDADAGPGTGMLGALYVDPPAQGAGLGTRMLAEVVEGLRADGFTEATLWIFTENGLGRAFYERYGWALDPSGAGQEGAGWHAPAVRYRREL